MEPLLAMSVIIAAQLRMDAAAASRRVRGALLSRCGGGGGKPHVPDSKACWVVQIRTGGRQVQNSRMFKFFQFKSRLQLNGD